MSSPRKPSEGFANSLAGAGAVSAVSAASAASAVSGSNPDRRASARMVNSHCSSGHGSFRNSVRRRLNAQNSPMSGTPRAHEPPDIILMDSNMPKMNGPDAVVEIRKLGFKSLILGVTGDEDHAAFMRAGADGVMMKPVKADELVKVIRAALVKQQEYRSTSGK
jgi:CheY-like chemotaxis protein